jgi:biopolymer transport protein ExbD
MPDVRRSPSPELLGSRRVQSLVHTKSQYSSPLQLGAAHAVSPILAGLLGVLLVILSPPSSGFVSRGYVPALPDVDIAPPIIDSPHDSDIVVRDDDSVFFQSRWVPESQLPTMFQAVAQQSYSHPASRVILRVDRSASFHTVRYLLRSLRELGIGEATLLVVSHNPTLGTAAPNPGVQRTRFARR